MIVVNLGIQDVALWLDMSGDRLPGGVLHARLAASGCIVTRSVLVPLQILLLLLMWLHYCS